MDLLKSSCALMGIIEPESKSNTQIDIAIRLTALFGPILLYWYHFLKSNVIVRLNIYTGAMYSVVLNFMKLYYNDNKEPDPLAVKTFDIYLILYAEHDFNASTFTARSTVSTQSDFYSGITSAIGTLRGNLHGGANEAAMDFLLPIKSIEQAESTVSLFCNVKVREYFQKKK